MADLEAIYRGIAAELRDVLPADEGQVFPWFQESPPTPSLSVGGLDVAGAESLSFGVAKQFLVIVEACLSTSSDRNGQVRLADWLSTAAVQDAVESANGAAGALTKRLLDDGTVQTGQPAACDSIGFDTYKGQQPRFLLPDGRVVLLASWAFRVLA